MKITEQDLRFQATQNVVGFTTPQSCMSGCFDSSFFSLMIEEDIVRELVKIAGQ